MPSRIAPTHGGVGPGSERSRIDSVTRRVSTQRWREAQLGEVAFWRTHAELIRSTTYRSRIEERAGRLERWLAPHDPGDHRRALEVGGGGTQLLDFFPIPLRLAVDPLAEFYRQAFGSVLSGSVKLMGTRGEELPFRSGSFDLILCRNVVDHAQRPSDVINELIRVLAPGGLLYVALNTFSGPLLFYRRLHPATEEPNPFSTKAFERLFVRTGLVELQRRIDAPEELEHYNTGASERSLRSVIRKRLIKCACLHFVELLLQKRSTNSTIAPSRCDRASS